jgi:hypothetical protein
MRVAAGGAPSTGRAALTTYILDGETLALDSLPDGELRQAYAYWRAQKGAKKFPSRHDISPEGMKPFLSKVMLIDVCHSPLDFIYRVFGTSIVTAHGKDFTGKSVRDLDPPAFAELIWRQYSEVLSIGDAVPHRVRLFAGNQNLNYYRVTMPLSTDGTTIDMLLAVSVESRDFWKAIH